MKQEYSKKENAEFVQRYGKSWKPKKDNIFLWTLTCSLSLTFILILILANRDYEIINKHLSEQFTEKYLKTLFSEIIIQTPQQSQDTVLFYSNIKISPESSGEISGAPDVDGTSEIPGIEQPAGLDLVEVNLPEALVAIKDRRSTESYVRPIQPAVNKSVEIEAVKPFDPWKTPVRRQGQIHIEAVEDIVRGSQMLRGWRDPDEITFALQKKEAMIEYCYKREAKYYSELGGYVIVQFIILHSGKVDPTSVRVIQSTLHNKKIEMCIKKRLQFWSGFEELDASNGSVVVTQKFIFD
jgi:hypothetical protein